MALVRIAFRRDTASTWTATNPVLASGEPGVETDTGKLKVGDGTRNWNTLPYASGTSLSSAAPPADGASSAGVSSLAARADHSHALPSAIAAVTVTATGSMVSIGDLTVGGRLNGGTHIHTSNDISDWSAKFANTLKSSLSAGANVSLTYGANNVITLGSTATGGGGVSAVTSVNGQVGAVVLESVTTPQLSDRLARLISSSSSIQSEYVAATQTITLTAGLINGGTYSGTSVIVPLSVSAQPANVTAVSGSASFSVTASGGTGTIVYQWQETANFPVAWANISGQATATLTLTSLTDAKNGYDYRCLVSSSSGESVTSASANLTVAGSSGTPLAISVQPVDLTIEPGGTYTLTTLAAAGGTAVVYHWELLSGTQWAAVGTNSPSYTDFAPNVPAGEEQMRCRITSGSATVYTRTVTITGGEVPFVITTQPASFTDCSVEIFMEYSYSGHLNHLVQWQQKAAAPAVASWYPVTVGVSGSNATATTPSDGVFRSTLNIAVLNAAMSGIRYRACIKSGVLSIASKVATATRAVTAITEQPSNQRPVDGQVDLFIDYDNGCAASTLTWERAAVGSSVWQTVPNATTPTLTVTGLTASRIGERYRVVILTPGMAAIISQIATILAPDYSFAWIQQPADASGDIGATLTFTTIFDSGNTEMHSWWETSTDGGVSWSNYAGTPAVGAPEQPASLSVIATETLSTTDFRRGVYVKATLGDGVRYYSESARLIVGVGVAADKVVSSSTDAKGIASNAAGTFVVLLASNGVTISRNGGDTWAYKLLPSSRIWSQILFGDGLFVVCAEDGFTATSADLGATWIQQQPTYLGSASAKASIAFLPSAPMHWVLMSGQHIYTSTRSAIAPTAAWIDRGTYGASVYPPSLFRDPGRPRIGPFGPDTSNIPNNDWGPLPPAAVAFGNGTYVLNHGNAASVSSNGVTWTSTSMVASASVLGKFHAAASTNLVFAGGVFVRATNDSLNFNDGRVTSPTSFSTLISIDGISWSDPPGPSPLPMTDTYTPSNGHDMRAGGYPWREGGGGGSYVALPVPTYEAEIRAPQGLIAAGDKIYCHVNGWRVVYGNAYTNDVLDGESILGILSPLVDPYAWDYVSVGGYGRWPVIDSDGLAVSGSAQLTLLWNSTGGAGSSISMLPMSLPGLAAPGAANAPASLGATVGYASSAFSLAVSWAAPSGAAVMPTGYQIHYDVTGSGWLYTSGVTAGSVTRFVISGITQGQTVRYRVRAMQGAVASAWVEGSTVVTATVPGMPPPLVTYSQSIFNDITFTIAPPASNGGSTITSYELGASRANIEYTLPYSGPAYAGTAAIDLANLRVRSVTTITRYTPDKFRIRAINVVGAGPWSDWYSPAPFYAGHPIVAPVTPVAPPAATTKPSAPVGLGGVSNSSSGFVLMWSPPLSTGGTAVTSYVAQVWGPQGSATPSWHNVAYANGTTATVWSVTYGASGDGSVQTATVSVNGTVRAGSTFQFRVRAINPNGTGTPTDPIGLTLAP